ncbi:MAG: hypothetical protein LBH94_04030, partial [Deltaproteobacteria bacterium]|nr:hypothetical protein [Deltaproteobacteria bacterium]
ARIRSKAFRTQQENRQVLLGLPGAVGGATVTAPQQPQPPLVQPAWPPGATSPQPPQPQPPPAGEAPGPTPAPPSAKSRKTEAPLSGINLIGCFEAWGIDSTQDIKTTRLEFEGLTVQQVKKILQGIPSAHKARLEIEYREAGEQ